MINAENNIRKFIDKSGRTYRSFEDYKSSNTLAKAAMLYPKDGTYTPSNEISKDGKVFYFKNIKYQL